MSKKTKPGPPARKIDLSGKPTEIGGKMFIEILIPIIKQVSESMTTEQQMLDVYAGILTAMHLSLNIEVGKQTADQWLSDMSGLLKDLRSVTFSDMAPAPNVH